MLRERGIGNEIDYRLEIIVQISQDIVGMMHRMDRKRIQSREHA